MVILKMMKNLFYPGLPETGSVTDQIRVVRDGVVNFYLVKTGSGLICIDAGWRKRQVTRAFASLGMEPADVRAVFLTHSHWDHARCSSLYPNATVYAGTGETRSRYTRNLRSVTEVRDGQILTIADTEVQVIGTPGHTRGSLAFLIGKSALFTGDILRLKNHEVCTFPTYFWNDTETLHASIRKLAGLEGIRVLLTAHSGILHEPASAFKRWREYTQ